MYDFKAVDGKWQKYWEDNKTFEAKTGKPGKKSFLLVEFPYPSGQGLHVGHPRSYTAIDSVARKRRLEGDNVLFAIGWDAFGLPAENYAIKNHIHPRVITAKNIANFKRQLKSIGFSFDWDREINTTDPEYYKWTQWIFLKMFEKGLAYKKEMPINWCTSCKCGLANEEVVGGVCERCGGEVIRKQQSQWMLKITAYAERLLEDIVDLDYADRIKAQQINWIGRSEGAQVDFKIDGTDDKLTVFTTRPDTLFGATYMVVSPEHPFIEKYKDKIANIDKVFEYRNESSKKSEFERTELAKDKTGVPLEGLMAVNPINGKKIPVWTSDYVLMTYGTGAIMAVPAHDTRDFDFAKKFGLEIIEVIKSDTDITKEAYTDVENGVMINSGFLDGMDCKNAIKTMIDHIENKGLGKRKVNYKLRDWVFSRQRYWGEPIPIVNCETCGYVPIPYDQLPLRLPEIEKFEPGVNGESPLNNCSEWVNTTCPKCGRKAKRETDTMPQWAGSSWYYLRYTDPNNKEAIASKEALNYWTPVDWYNGGMEHTTLHLLYSRFWHKFLYDIGVVPTKEPYVKRSSHGMILGENGEKMSKSRGNVINPDDMVNTYGADAFRTYELFIGAFDQATPWSTQGLSGCHKFLDRVWNLKDMIVSGAGYSTDLEGIIHKTIKKVSEDIEKIKFNTAIATLMALVNEFYKKGSVNKSEYKTLITLLNPFAPHITEELWQLSGYEGTLSNSKWPSYDESKTIDDTIEMAVMIGGKVKSKILVPNGLDEESVKDMALNDNKTKEALAGKTVVKIIVVPGKLVNIVSK
ncbi:MAG: leucine--tRNA ligase [Bacillota bacterium]|nr:leucine--tRNA ligase [Bacillota bacterium]